MKNREDKVARAAHIKHNTRGTSNEISLSVLDAAKNSQADDGRAAKKTAHFPRLGDVFLFTLGRVKKPAPTPTKERGITLSTGEFVSAEQAGRKGSSTPELVPGIATESSSAGKLEPANAASAASAAAGAAPVTPATPAASAVPAPLALGAASGATAAVPKGSGSPAVSTATPSASSAASLGASPSGRAFWESPAQEVSRRKTRRLRRRRVALAAAAVCVVAAVAFAAHFLYTEFQDQQDRKGQLAALVESVFGTDTFMEQLDGRMYAMTPASLGANAEEGSLTDPATLENVQRDIAEAQKDLQVIEAEVKRVQTSMENAQDGEMANQALLTLNARIKALKAIRATLEVFSPATAAYMQAQEGWNLVLSGDTAARNAAALVEDVTVDNVKASIAKSNEAIGLFNQAINQLQLAQQTYSVDLSSYVEYLSLRIDAQYAAIASDQAYLDRNKEETAAKNDAYNDLDAQAVALIKDQPSDPMDVIEEAFEAEVEESLASYEAERLRSSDSDTILRDYLGSISK